MNSEIIYGLYVSNYAFQRHDLVAALNMDIQRLNLLSKGMIQYNGDITEYEDTLRDNVIL